MLTTTLNLVKETKALVKYEAGGDEQALPFATVYVPKTALAAPYPPAVEIRVRWDDR